MLKNSNNSVSFSVGFIVPLKLETLDAVAPTARCVELTIAACNKSYEMTLRDQLTSLEARFELLHISAARLPKSCTATVEIRQTKSSLADRAYKLKNKGIFSVRPLLS